MDQSRRWRREGRGRRSGGELIFSCGALFASLSVLGCGGRTGDDGATCDAVAGCGGDITGNWDVTAICTRAPDNAPPTTVTACDTARRRAFLNASFSLTDAGVQFFGNTYSQGGTTTFDTTFVFPDACLAEQGLGSASSDTCGFLEATLAFHSHLCSPDSGTCRCAVSDSVPNDSGSYRVTGSDIFFKNDTESGRFCVQGDRAIFSIGSSGDSSLAQGLETRYSLRRHQLP